MVGLAQLVVVHLDQSDDGFFHRLQLRQRHLAVLRKELEGLDGQALLLKGGPQVGLLDGRRNVGQVEGGRRRVDVGVVFRAGLLEPVQVGRRVILGQAGIGLALLGQLDAGVLAGSHPDLLAPQLRLVQMRYCLKK